MISIVDARENNLSLSVEIPAGAITLITGPSGSGKTSLVIDTIAAFGIYQLAVLNRLQGSSDIAPAQKPRVGTVSGLPPVAAVPRSATAFRNHTVASALALDRRLFPIAAAHGTRCCPECGAELKNVSLDTAPEEIGRSFEGKMIAITAVLAWDGLEPDADALLRTAQRLDQQGLSRFIIGCEEVRLDALLSAAPLPRRIEAVIDRFTATSNNARRLLDSIHTAALHQKGGVRCLPLEPDGTPADGAALHFSSRPLCPQCRRLSFELTPSHFDFRLVPHGESAPDRLRGFASLDSARRSEMDAISIGGMALAEIVSGEITEIVRRSPLPEPSGAPPAHSLSAALRILDELGLGHLALKSPITELSSGERQRIRIALQASAAISHIAITLDEPTGNLHWSDAARVSTVLHELQRTGATVILAGHCRELLCADDTVIALGPGAGIYGGKITFQGALRDLPADPPAPPPALPRVAEHSALRIRGARLNNLKGIEAAFPLHAISCITGVSGSGKSSLLWHTLAPAIGALLSPKKDTPAAVTYDRLELHPSVTAIHALAPSQMPPPENSVIGSFLDLGTPLRELFSQLEISRIRGYTPKHFAPAELYGDSADRLAQVRFKDHSLREILALEVDAAAKLLGAVPRCSRVLELLQEFKLGFLRLDQPLWRLSSGELQRLRLAQILLKTKRNGCLYLFDEPAAGLTPAETIDVLAIFRGVVARGNTILAVEHNLTFIAHCDYLIDLGPGAGKHGGSIVEAGIPHEIAARAASLTGKALMKFF